MSGSRIGEYEPAPGVSDELIELINDFVNDVVLKKDNRGESILRQWCMDGLLQKVGTVKVSWCEDIQQLPEETYEGLTEAEFAFLANQEDTEVTAYQEVIASVETVDPVMGLPAVVNQVTIDATIQRSKNKSRVKIEGVPPEEFFINRDSRGPHDWVIQSHRTEHTVGRLIEMGFDEERVMRLPGHNENDFTSERQTRLPNADYSSADRLDAYMREVALHEGIVKCNYDGTGVKEWYFIVAGTEDALEVLQIEPYKCQVTFCHWSPRPLPHVFYGRSIADETIEHQKLGTVLKRQLLNNIYLTNSPKQLVLENQVKNMDALTSFAPGQPVIAKSPQAVTPLSVPFMGRDTLQALEYFRNETQRRTGVSESTAGLDPETLSNQSATAANFQQAASQGQIEDIARIWATGGMRDLFRAILVTLTEYQDFTRITKLRGREVEIDPREWGDLSDLDVNINTGLGTGSKERDLAALGLIATKQEQLLMQDPANGVASLGQYANTLRAIADTAGLPDADRYFTKLPEDYQPPQQQDPEAAKAQAEMQLEMQKVQAKAQADQQQAQLKAQNDFAIAEKKAQMEAEVERYKAQLNAEIEREKLAIQQRMKEQELAMEMQLEQIRMQNQSPAGNGNIPQVQ